jgi:hypothetical protein
MKIIVRNTTEVLAAVTDTIEAEGGSVKSSSVWRDGEVVRARITLRLPPHRLTPTLALIRALSQRVESETVSEELAPDSARFGDAREHHVRRASR